MVNDNINELLRKKVGGNYGVGGQQTPGAEINTPEGIAIARNFLNPSASTKLNEMIDDIRRAATTRIGAPTAAQGNLMNDALQAQLGVAGITGESARGVYEKAKLDAAVNESNAARFERQNAPTTPAQPGVVGKAPTVPSTNYDEVMKAIKRIKISPISTDRVGG